MTTPCQEDPELWFANEKENRALAAAECRAKCPLVTECFAGALERRERYGVWGGADFELRRYWGKPREPKRCEECGQMFTPRQHQSDSEAAKRRFCSRTCGNRWTHRDRMARRRVA